MEESSLAPPKAATSVPQSPPSQPVSLSGDAPIAPSLEQPLALVPSPRSYQIERREPVLMPVVPHTTPRQNQLMTIIYGYYSSMKDFPTGKEIGEMAGTRSSSNAILRPLFQKGYLTTFRRKSRRNVRFTVLGVEKLKMLKVIGEEQSGQLLLDLGLQDQRPSAPAPASYFVASSAPQALPSTQTTGGPVQGTT